MKKSACSRLVQTILDFVTVIIGKELIEFLEKNTFILFLISVSIIFVLIFAYLHPFERGFYCTDDTIRYPYKPDDTIPLWAAGLYGALSAIFIIIFTELYVNRPCCIDESKFRTKRSRCNTGIINAILIYAMGAMATLLITEIGKHTIGRPRPHFFDICQPKWEQLECFEKKFDKVGNQVMLPKYVQIPLLTRQLIFI